MTHREPEGVDAVMGYSDHIGNEGFSPLLLGVLPVDSPQFLALFGNRLY